MHFYFYLLSISQYIKIVFTIFYSYFSFNIRILENSLLSLLSILPFFSRWVSSPSQLVLSDSVCPFLSPPRDDLSSSGVVWKSRKEELWDVSGNVIDLGFLKDG
ncbi:hypothetical protein TNIN_211621 [Trichonephila inaurata madagascariensis]|uniref:Uncharacterized protein n=1 Tax=Trichonephila inaurata madagascariensis TaxID=2747483 RepID=A0A8X6Y0W1_9ARAC|nr:hypothetical protein TNIN_211621 [Trichonephila inaurata madagascariensis]